MVLRLVGKVEDGAGKQCQARWYRWKFVVGRTPAPTDLDRVRLAIRCLHTVASITAISNDAAADQNQAKSTYILTGWRLKLVPRKILLKKNLSESVFKKD